MTRDLTPSSGTAHAETAPGNYRVVALGPDTWSLFAELTARNNGVYGGCWCLGWHQERRVFVPDRQGEKKRLVRSGNAHAALMLDADGVAQGWAQYGSPEELPGIRHGREYRKDEPPRPDWRITCVFTDSKNRRQGVARAAVAGALDLIAAAGGGVVEAISETTSGRQAQGRFLFSATAELLEDLGFTRARQVGKHAWILTATVGPPRQQPVQPYDRMGR